MATNSTRWRYALAPLPCHPPPSREAASECMHANRRAAQADISLDHLHLRWGAGAVSNAIAPGRGSVKTGGRGSLGGSAGRSRRPPTGCRARLR